MTSGSVSSAMRSRATRALRACWKGRVAASKVDAQVFASVSRRIGGGNRRSFPEQTAPLQHGGTQPSLAQVGAMCGQTLCQQTPQARRQQQDQPWKTIVPRAQQRRLKQ